MEVLSTKIKFLVVLFVGMISVLVIYENSGSVHHYINRTAQNNLTLNDLVIEKSEQKDEYISKDKKIDSQLNTSLQINRFLNIRDSIEETEHKKLLSKIIEFESKYLIPIKKLSYDSKLLYPMEVKSITVTTIGDQNCDNNYGSDLKVVIIVISRVNGFERRQTLRKSWAKRIPESKTVKLYFAIGLSKESETQKRLLEENNKFNDLLQWNFIDNYYNLTIKSLAILRWFSIHCHKSNFLYKIDDDCIVNLDNLVKFTASAHRNTIYGHLWKKAFVDRKTNSKFFLSKSDFKLNSYPDYTGGPWLMSGAVVPILYETAITQSLPALPYEDVYITGLVATKAGIKRRQLSGLVYFSKTEFNKLNNCWFSENIIFWQNLDDLMIKNIWHNIENSRQLICVQSNGSTIYPKKT